MDQPEILFKSSTPRRDFIKKSLIGFGGFIFLQRCSIEVSRWKFFSNSEGALLEAIAEQFIPADDDPGAIDACVVNFIDTQLTKNYIRFQQKYRVGLKSIEQSCTEMTGKSFQKLNKEEQIVFLENLESNQVSLKYWIHEKPAVFFNLILSHCMQGFYGDPRHGGNCNHVSYKMIDLRVVQFYQPETTGAI